MRVKTAKRGKRTAGRVHYCPRCANDLVAGGEIDIFPLAAAVNYWSAPLEGACAITVSLNKRGRWGLLKNLKSAKREKEAGPRDKVPQYHDTPEGTYLCGGTAGFPRPRPRDTRPAFLHKIKPSMVVLSRDEVMEVLPESDWTYLTRAAPWPSGGCASSCGTGTARNHTAKEPPGTTSAH